MAVPPSSLPSLSEEILPTAAVMESGCRRRHSPGFNREQSSAGRIHTIAYTRPNTYTEGSI